MPEDQDKAPSKVTKKVIKVTAVRKNPGPAQPGTTPQETGSGLPPQKTSKVRVVSTGNPNNTLPRSEAPPTAPIQTEEGSDSAATATPARPRNIYEINQNMRASPREQLGGGPPGPREKPATPPEVPAEEGPKKLTREEIIRRNLESGRRSVPYQGGRGGGPQGGRPYPQRTRPGETSRPADSRTSRFPQRKTVPGRPFENRPASFAPASGFSPAKPDSIKKFRQKKAVEKDKTFAKEKEKEKPEKILSPRKQNVQKANPIPKQIEILEAITVNDLAKKMNLKVSELIQKLMQMGLMVTMNQQIDHETAAILAAEYGTEVKVISLYEETIIKGEEDNPDRMQPRPPVVTVMGHVDHGKTKLLDAIRQTDVAGDEHGGITQHIGAYQVHHSKGAITFFDTPGHEAFSLMRARGAQVTDIVVLVVAANDGVMPQTIEAIRHAQEARVPIIVAINKIDLPDANPERIKQQLSEYDLTPEEWGGQTLYVEISALKKIGIDALIEAIHLQAEVLDLKADPGRRAEGRVIESKIDQGRGIVATILVQKGTLRIGDPFVGGIFPGKVRAMFNDKGQNITEAGPSTPVEVMGFEGIPSAGDPFQVTRSEKEAREYAEKRQELKRQESSKNVKKITMSNIYDTIQESNILELKVIIKADTHGSMEALKGALTKLSTDEIRLNVIHGATGPIVREDVYLASASKALIVGFHVRPSADAQEAADQEKVEIRKYNIIYDAVDDIRAVMEGMLAPELQEKQIGTAEVRELFRVPKVGVVAGCHVIQGKIKRTSMVHVIRDGIQVFSGKLGSLKRFKDDAKEVAEGFDCGMSIENFQDIQVGDLIEAYEVVKVAKKLEAAT